MISSSQRPLTTRDTTNTRDEQPCPRRDSKTRSQQPGGLRLTPPDCWDRLSYHLANSNIPTQERVLKTLFLMFMGPCIVSIFQYISNKMQSYTVSLYLETALHVSGGTSTHHQERIQLYLQHLVFFTPLLLPAAIVAGSSNGVTNTRCCRYSCMRS